MDIAGYLDEITRIYNSGDATEHSYRAPLQRLFESIDDTALGLSTSPSAAKAGCPIFCSTAMA